jgi:hypothetical protein
MKVNVRPRGCARAKGAYFVSNHKWLFYAISMLNAMICILNPATGGTSGLPP